VDFVAGDFTQRAGECRGRAGDRLPLRAGPGDADGDHGRHRARRRAGILVKNAEALELAKNVEVLAVDKTGTLTQGKPEVTDVVPAPRRRPSMAELLRIAASLEQGATHPLAEAIVARARGQGLNLAQPAGLRAVPGKGLTAMLDGEEYALGSPAFLAERGVAVPEALLAPLANSGKSVVAVSRGLTLLGLVGVADRLRPTSRAAVARN
jgi:Cu+-exporting ATPase